jgi:SAM-dependent methyltransferase
MVTSRKRIDPELGYCEENMSFVARIVMHPDTYARHALAARLLGHPETVLDVGGVRGGLARFLPQSRIVVANVEPPADVVFDGRRLPFPDSSFAAATSLDVLEHLPREERAAHVAELARVARGHVVLASPLGSEQHVEAERALAAWYEATTGAAHPRLAQHVAYGLPTGEDLLALAEAAGLRGELFFQGDFHSSERLFRLAARARRNPLALMRYAARRIATAPDLTLTRTSLPHTNRAFLLAESR